MSDKKGRRIYEKMNPEIRSGYYFVRADCWRDDHHVYLTLQHGETGRIWQPRVNRETGELLDIGFGLV